VSQMRQKRILQKEKVIYFNKQTERQCIVSKKEIFTNNEIEKDIINALKMPADESEASYKKWSIPCAIFGCLIGVGGIFYPTILIWVLLALIPLLGAGAIAYRIFLNRRIKKVSVEDHEIKTAVVSHTNEDSYVVRRGGHYSRRETIHVFTIYFEDGKRWDIPKDNYLWSVERPMSDLAIFHAAHRGDVFIVVSRKDDGEIVMAYDTEFFEYKER